MAGMASFHCITNSPSVDVGRVRQRKSDIRKLVRRQNQRGQISNAGTFGRRLLRSQERSASSDCDGENGTAKMAFLGPRARRSAREVCLHKNTAKLAASGHVQGVPCDGRQMGWLALGVVPWHTFNPGAARPGVATSDFAIEGP